MVIDITAFVILIALTLPGFFLGGEANLWIGINKTGFYALILVNAIGVACVYVFYCLLISTGAVIPEQSTKSELIFLLVLPGMVGYLLTEISFLFLKKA